MLSRCRRSRLPLFGCRCLSAPSVNRSLLDPSQIRAYQRDGAVVVRNVFDRRWLEVIAAGVERNLANPSVYSSENSVGEGEGRFFDDYVNYERIPEYQQIVNESPAAELAALAMQSRQARFFHDHLLVKEAGTSKETPWHMDLPYYCVSGEHSVSMWIPLEPVNQNTLRFIAGSHLWEKMVKPVSWADDSSFYDQDEEGMWRDVPKDPDSDPEMEILEWEMEPGDVVLFHFRTCHGARGNHSSIPRRALSLRWVGDDEYASYTQRPGPTSPPFPNNGMQPGEPLRSDWFPVIWKDET